MAMDVSELTALIGIVGSGCALAGLAVEHFHFQGSLQERIARLETKGDQIPLNTQDIRQMVNDITEMKTKISLFWGALEEQLPGLLLKGNPIDPNSRLFKLLEKYEKKEILPEECPKLIELLKEEAKNDEHAPGEKLAMVLTVAVVKANINGTCQMYHEVF